MQRMTNLAAGAVAVLLLANAAQAAQPPLISAAIPSGLPNALAYDCIATNAGTKDVTVTVEIANAFTGATIIASGATVLSPGESLVQSSSTLTTSYCRAIGLTSKTGKLSYYLYDSGFNLLMSVTAP